ncbi:hypothetical protein BH18ACI2_BH18ACI2_17780 [soil metagenome]
MHTNPTALSANRCAVLGERPPQRFYLRMVCALFGHQVSNRVFNSTRGHSKHCRCEVEYLAEDDSETRISHTVSCFLGGHRYTRAGARNNHHEYVCLECGHPLLFKADDGSYGQQKTFSKRVRYLCNLFGHRVHQVGERNGLTEYACYCGHCFLKHARNSAKIKHPVRCLFAGHYVRFVERREAYAEFLCRHCGHTFCFVANNLG